MLVSYKWLKDYVDIDVDTKELEYKLTMAGLEVDKVKHLAENWDGILVGKIEDIVRHPYADKLSTCLVDLGESEYYRVVCGAPNIEVGQKVVVATPGSSLPTGHTIETTTIRQVTSEGMICSAQELDLDENFVPDSQAEGIIVLPADTPVGTKAEMVLGLDDVVFELDLTPNRSDCMSVFNIAREVGAITGAELKYPDIKLKEDQGENVEDYISVDINDEDLCRRYVAKAVKDITIKPSPMWMQNRLKAAGVRPINNIVDVTNYVMLEMGQPLHAFDHRFLEGQRIIVRRADKGEKIVTLDEQERELDSNMLLICDAEKPVALAGVMGGFNSEIHEDTSTVLIESANFDPINIRQTSKKVNLRSESSIRFEKGVDVEGALNAANRAAQLMADLGDGLIVSGTVDNYPRKWEPVRIDLRPHRVNQLLELELSNDKIKELLESIDLKVESDSSGSFTVSIPPFRLDLEREVDLVEEVARLYGYDKIQAAVPKGEVSQIPKSRHQIFEEKCKDLLTACGLTEVITFSFISPSVFDKIRLPENDALRVTTKIANPLTEEQSVMRTTLLPNLLETAQRNVNRKVENLKIFEFGRIFLPLNGDQPHEKSILSGLLLGEVPRGWSFEDEKIDFFYLKGILEELFEHLNMPGVLWVQSDEYPYYHPGRTAEIRVSGRKIGTIGEIHPEVIENYELPSRACAFQLEFDELIQEAKEIAYYKPVAKFPSAERDMAFIVSEEVKAADIEKVIKEIGGDILANYEIFDVYRGKQIPEGKKSIAYSLVYQADDRTLTDGEVDARHEDIKQKIAENFDAELR